jgi:hypothetical protein
LLWGGQLTVFALLLDELKLGNFRFCNNQVSASEELKDMGMESKERVQHWGSKGTAGQVARSIFPIH